MTIKLYKTVDGHVVEYHEAFLYENRVHQHWGKLGEEGEGSSQPRTKGRSVKAEIEHALTDARARGFAEIEIDAHAVLLVEYPVQGMGSGSDLEKMGRLMELLDDLLGQTGLGHCDGNSIGSGTMEAACFVVDFEVARRVIAKALTNTEFADYSRIYNEGAS